MMTQMDHDDEDLVRAMKILLEMRIAMMLMMIMTEGEIEDN